MLLRRPGCPPRVPRRLTVARRLRPSCRHHPDGFGRPVDEIARPGHGGPASGAVTAAALCGSICAVGHPRDREAFEQAVVRGSEQLKQGKVDLAQSAFREALALEPDNPRVLALLGLSHFRANAFAEARAIYEQLVERAPSDASHRLNLGLVYLKLNDAERAIAALETSRALH